MFSPFFALFLMSVGFVAGYGVRALISRKRRASERLVGAYLDCELGRHGQGVKVNARKDQFVKLFRKGIFKSEVDLVQRLGKATDSEANRAVALV